jgi:hypothetical protein
MIRHLPILLSLACTTQALAEITIEKTATGGAVVKIDGRFFTEYVVDQANKPYLYPIIGAADKKMTRDYPMKKVEGEQHDHPHHRGLNFGHEDIGGYDTWAEDTTFKELGKDPKRAAAYAERLKHLGSQKHGEIKVMESGAEKATLTVMIDYLDATGKKTLEEERQMTFRTQGGNRMIDVDQTLIASEGNVMVGDKKDSGLSIRVPTEMCVQIEKDKKGNGTIVNSAGQKDEEAWGKRATWCDYSGTVDGAKVGVAILNHPSSFRHPTPWHVRTYGLFTANPFGTKSLDKNAEDGAFELKKGDSIKLRHRFLFHEGDAASAKIAEAFEAYAKES